MLRRFTLSFLCLALVTPAWGGKKKLSSSEVEALLDAARVRYTLGDPIEEPLRVQAQVRFLFDEKAPVGVYEFVAAGPDRWRREIAVPGWSEVTVRADDRFWTWEHERNQEQLTLLATWVNELLDPAELLGRVRDLRGRRVNFGGRRLVELSPSHGQGWLYRFEEDTARFVSYDFGSTRYRFTGEREAGGRFWPAAITVESDRRPVLQISVGEPLRGAEALPDDAFTPPEGAKERVGPNLDGLTPPRLLTQSAPVYPAGPRKEGVSGTVIIRAVIDKEGRVKEPKVLVGVHPALDASALDAVGQRRYSPGLVEGRPVEVITTIRLAFTLR